MAAQSTTGGISVGRRGQSGPDTTFVVQAQGAAQAQLRRRRGLQACQAEIDAAIDSGSSEQWLQLRQVLQNIPGKAIATMLASVKDHGAVVAKVQLADEARREFDVQARLAQEGVSGFVRYHCMFTCNSPEGAQKYISAYGDRLTAPHQAVCAAKGGGLGVILMPYYRLESLDAAARAGSLAPARVAAAVASVIVSATVAFLRAGFVHGDLFLKNALLDSDAEGQTVIIDFEKSTFGERGDPNHVMRFWRDLLDLLGDAAWHANLPHLDDLARQHVTMNMAYGRPPSMELIAPLTRALRAAATGGAARPRGKPARRRK